MIDLRFDVNGLVPVVVQDAATGQVLMMASMTRQALEHTTGTGDAWYWSRSRQALWRKGEQSGHTQRVREIRMDCDGDAVLLLVDPQGPACHTGHGSCFYRTLQGDEVEGLAPRPDVLEELFDLLRRRKREMPEESYTTRLLRAGRGAIAAKVQEESEELVRAAREESDRRVVEEAADLLYHTWVLLVERGVELSDVRDELMRRRNGG